MKTVFSHIIQKRYSQSYEDVATDALAFILHSNESARNGMMKLLRGVVADIPSLRFKTQQSEGSIRPDMWGFDGTEPRVFVENKFWAGLTDNQPVFYLKQLVDYTQPTILLVVGPEARMQTLWRELVRRLEDAGISVTDRAIPAGMVNSITTEDGPILALTSWSRLLSTLELEVADDQSAKSDLLQLRSLCEAADIDAFAPISSSEVTDQRTPAFILDLSSIVQASVDLAVTEGVLSIKGLRPQADWEGIGRYARFSNKHGADFWYGTYFPYWKEHGGTPLWLIFSEGEYCRSHEVRSLLEPWAAKEGIFTYWEDYEFVMAVDIETGEEEDQVVRSIVERLRGIAEVLSALE